MYIYVPDKVATNPPILTLIHYCGGTASAVFGQAQGGGIVSGRRSVRLHHGRPRAAGAAGTRSRARRWTRDGGGDSHAIRQMVRYAVAKYKANADRVYATGDSSGGMMTELLLALYPDVFKAGSAFAGMPAACRGTNESGTGGGYSGACAGGNVTHTAQQWGDIARMLDPGYTGHRPRVQMFHGDADPTIKYVNFTEAIKEWTNVLGLAANPTTTTMNVTLGMHQATRAAVAECVRLPRARRLHVDRRRSRPVRRAVQGRLRDPVPRSRQDGRGQSRDRSSAAAAGRAAARALTRASTGGRWTAARAPRAAAADREPRARAERRQRRTRRRGGGTGGATTGTGGASAGAGGSGHGGTVGTGGTGASGQGGQSGGGTVGGADASGQGGAGDDGQRGGSSGTGSGGTSGVAGAAGSPVGGDSGGCSCGVANDTSARKAISLLALGVLALVTFARGRRKRPRFRPLAHR